MSTDLCSILECDKHVHARGLCPMHYQRARLHGDVGTASPQRLGHCGKVCDVEGCGQPRRKRGWCASHYSQWRRTGAAQPFTRKWAERTDCVACGAPTTQLRQFCGAACYAIWQAYGGEPPTAVTCRQCGESIPLSRTGGRRRRVDTLVCKRCRHGLRKHAMSVGQLAARDGADCGICGRAIDMAAEGTNPDRPSVDHVIPKALGGPNVPTNLQLAHLRCNSGKQHRLQAEMVA